MNDEEGRIHETVAPRLKQERTRLIVLNHLMASRLPLHTALLAMALGLCAHNASAERLPLFPIRVGDKHGLIDINGREIVPPEYSRVELGDPWISLTKGSKTAFADYAGKLLIPPQTAIAGRFAHGLAPAYLDSRQDSAYGYVNADGRTAISPQFDYADVFADGVAIAGRHDEWGQLLYGAIDTTGAWIVRPIYKKRPPGLAPACPDTAYSQCSA